MLRDPHRFHTLLAQQSSAISRHQVHLFKEDRENLTEIARALFPRRRVPKINETVRVALARVARSLREQRSAS